MARLRIQRTAFPGEHKYPEGLFVTDGKIDLLVDIRIATFWNDALEAKQIGLATLGLSASRADS